jgi:hypothetical protein
MFNIPASDSNGLSQSFIGGAFHDKPHAPTNLFKFRKASCP